MRHIKGTPELTPYQKIIRAALTGKGVRLSHIECCMLKNDDAIITAAEVQSEALRNVTPWTEYLEEALSDDYD